MVKNHTITYEKWPTYDESKIAENTLTIAVQVNGKVRGKLEVDVDTPSDILQEKAFTLPNVQNFTNGKEIVKVIAIPNKIVNIVVKG